MKRSTKIVADVCLYGSSLVSKAPGGLVDGRSLGDGEPREWVSATDAVFTACKMIRGCGYNSGKVRVFMPSGEWMAITDLNKPEYFGDLKWEPAVKYVLSVEDILEAASLSNG